MTLWEIRPQKGIFELYLPDEELAKVTHTAGLNPTFVRHAFKVANANEICFQLVTPAGAIIKAERQIVPDLLFWSWIPIFSHRATVLADKLGCAIDDFWKCRIESNPEEIFFLHLPTQSYDIVDVKNSTFLLTIPGVAGGPSLPHNIQVLKTKHIPDALPVCFRARVPGHQQVFSELFVSDEFKIAWERGRHTGATFRRLT